MFKNKSIKYCILILYILSVLSYFLPWFTYHPGVMGYRRGYLFSFLFFVPMLILGFCILYPRKGRILLAAARIDLFVILIFHFIALGIWQEVCNIKAGFHLIEGFYTSQPGFWISYLIHSILLLLIFLPMQNNEHSANA